jgi:hypothetical protein
MTVTVAPFRRCAIDGIGKIEAILCRVQIALPAPPHRPV